MTQKPEKTIGLWRGHPNTEPGTAYWRVSEDELDERGRALYSRTLATYDDDQYSEARAHGAREAATRGIRLIDTDQWGTTSRIW